MQAGGHDISEKLCVDDSVAVVEELQRTLYKLKVAKEGWSKGQDRVHEKPSQRRQTGQVREVGNEYPLNMTVNAITCIC